MSLQDFCRACLRPGPTICPLWESIVPRFDSPPNFIVDLWKIFSHILMAREGSSPNKICIECLDEIQRTYSFVLNCKKTQIILRKMKNMKIRLKKLKTTSPFRQRDSTSIVRVENDGYPNFSQIKIECNIKRYGDGTENADCGKQEINVFHDNENLRNKLLNDQVYRTDIAERATVLLEQDIKHEPELDICMGNEEFDVVESNAEDFKCPGCCYDYRKMESLEKHIIHNHMEGKICKLCDEEFECSSTEHCSEHLRMSSPNKIPKPANLKHLKCKVCSKKFGCKFTLTRHLLIHTEERPYKCELCSKSFRQKNNLTYHLRCHTGERPFKCPLCPKTFLLKNRLTNHFKRHRERNARKNRRKRCTNVDNIQVTSLFQDQTDHFEIKLLEQLESENSNAKNVVLLWDKPVSELGIGMEKNNLPEIEDRWAIDIYECPACRFACRIMENLEEHIIEEHMDRDLCKLCNREFKCSAIEHCSTHLHVNNTQEVPKSTNIKHQCKVCSKIFEWKSNLNEHLKIHAGKRPFKCEICPKTFQREAPFLKHLKRHTEKIHKKSGYNPELHKCKVCSKIFRCKSNLKRHLVVHTGERPFKCDICPKSYQQKIGLKNHLRSHIGESVVR